MGRSSDPGRRQELERRHAARARPRWPGAEHRSVSPSIRPRPTRRSYRYQLGDFSRTSIKTEDYGETWTRITTGSNGIPNDYPVRVVREDPDREGPALRGNRVRHVHLLRRRRALAVVPARSPGTPITDIKVVNQDLALSTMGRSFWILDDLTPLHEIPIRRRHRRCALSRCGDTYRLRQAEDSACGAPQPESPSTHRWARISTTTWPSPPRAM